MTMIEPVEMSTADREAIVRRTSTPMTDEGYRAWYQKDVIALMQECLALRRDLNRVRNMLVIDPSLSREPTDGVPTLTLMNRLLTTVHEAETGVWQRAEVKRIKGSIDELTSERDQYIERVRACDESMAQQQERLSQLEADIVDLKRGLVDAQTEWQVERGKLISRLDGALADEQATQARLNEAYAAARADQILQARQFDQREAEIKAEADRAVANARGAADTAIRMRAEAQRELAKANARSAEVHDLIERVKGLT